MKDGCHEFYAGEMVKRDTDQVGVLISESEFHKGYWKVLADGEVQEWFVGNFSFVEPAKRPKSSLHVK